MLQQEQGARDRVRSRSTLPECASCGAERGTYEVVEEPEDVWFCASCKEHGTLDEYSIYYDDITEGD